MGVAQVAAWAGTDHSRIFGNVPFARGTWCQYPARRILNETSIVPSRPPQPHPPFARMPPDCNVL